ncbi:hypothetical protein [Methylobacterium persicinum]|uniref:Uncharacterized protein n=1 Tax=Methylobacterium persicinum TaxID=374426 RepID=A0ABU0HJC5_9HYPH|nr:hypothetical protein [Methylobacterium persicinum]MDQ0441820.1 hypothetical protein [Methylobacterium persicinum]
MTEIDPLMFHSRNGVVFYKMGSTAQPLTVSTNVKGTARRNSGKRRAAILLGLESADALDKIKDTAQG